MNNFIFIVLLLLFVGCENRYEDEARETLMLAGDNTGELLKVLDHYKGENRNKYQAACFIIANMRYHKTLQDVLIPQDYYTYFSKIDSTYNTIFNSMSGKEILSFNPVPNDSLRRALATEYAQLSPIFRKKVSRIYLL